MFQLPWEFSMHVTCNVTDVRCNVRQLQHGGWGKGAGKQSICCICSSNLTLLVWICHHTKEFLGLQGTKQQQNNQLFKIHKVKTFLSGSRIVLPEERTCLLCWTGRCQTQNGSRDHRKENPGKQAGPCAAMATQSW